MSELNRLNLTRLMTKLDELSQQLAIQIKALKSSNAKNQQLNEKIVTYDKADQVMQENQTLRTQASMLEEAAQAGKRDAEQQVEYANKLITKAMNKESHLDTLIDREARAGATQDSI